MSRIITGIACAVIASAVTAGADVSPTAFWQSQLKPTVKSALDITAPGYKRHREARKQEEPKSPVVSSHFIRGRLKCAENVTAMLKANGYRGTGSAMARSYLSYGVAVSSPRPGAIQVERRGGNPNAGHVQIVSHKSNGVWMCKNPSSRVGSWVLQPCANNRIIAYRMPTASDVLSTQYASRAVLHSAYAPATGIFGIGQSALVGHFTPQAFRVGER
jgi:hypothetical protein